MTRRLLPYEHDLIATLGVTEEEYIDFLSIQEAYSDPKEGTIVDVRNGALAALPAVIAGTATAAATAAVVATLTTISIALCPPLSQAQPLQRPRQQSLLLLLLYLLP